MGLLQEIPADIAAGLNTGRALVVALDDIKKHNIEISLAEVVLDHHGIKTTIPTAVATALLHALLTRELTLRSTRRPRLTDQGL